MRHFLTLSVSLLSAAVTLLSQPAAAADSAQFSAVAKLNSNISRSLTHNLGLQASIGGPSCDVLLVDSPETNLLEGMVDFIHTGQKAYADIWPGGISAFASSNRLSKVAYRNKHDKAVFTFGTGLTPKAAKSYKSCTNSK